MAGPPDSGRGITPSDDVAAVLQPPGLRRGRTVGFREADAGGQVNPVGRGLRPRAEFVSTYTSFNFDASVGTLDGGNSVEDDPGLNRRVETVLRQGVDEPLNSVAHYAIGPFWRIDTNLASFSMTTISSSS